MLAQARCFSSLGALLDVETLHSKHCAQKGTEGKTGRGTRHPFCCASWKHLSDEIASGLALANPPYEDGLPPHV